MTRPVRLPFDPIARAAELWRARWGADSRSLSMATATSVMRVQQLLIGQFDAIAGRRGLSFARYEALVLLAFSRDGALSMSKIGERLMVHPTSATNIVQRLVAQGFVERVPNPRDRRGAFAVITPAGREAMEAVTADLEQVDFGLAMLEEDSQRALFAMLRTVRVGARDFEDPASAGVPREPSASPPGSVS
ncbi:MAG: MarR family transcriptional regulator [Ornithinibacter sp.]